MPIQSSVRVSEPVLEYWGRVFTAGRFIDRGIDFERFLRSPHTFVSPARAELLAEAGDVERELLSDKPDARLRDCHLVEPLHHHAFGHHRPMRRV